MAELVVGFDLDMTLIDSRPGIAATLEALSAETGVAIDADLVVNRLGPTLEEEMGNWFPPEQVATVSDRYRELYSDLGVAGCSLLPGAAEAVGAVASAGGRTVVITAKYEPNARSCVEHVGLAVDVVVGWRWGPAKAIALAEHGAVAYVGDTPTDIAAARKAGAVALGVPSGPHPAEELTAAGADLVLGSLADFTGWFDEFRQARDERLPRP
jgi:phosphoglycolate phosphatase-like HAD superfamily hydrolase